MKALELVVRLGGPLGYAAAIPLLYHLDTHAPLLLVVLLPVVLVAAELAPISLPFDRERMGTRGAVATVTVAAFLLLIGWGAVTVADSGDIPVLGLAVGVGAGVFAMIAAHELIHSHRRQRKIVGVLMLTGLMYRHFRISHLFGHHRWAATERDPTSAPRGENVYGFIWRSVRCQLVDTYRAEERRLLQPHSSRQRNRLRDDIAIYIVIFAVLFAAIGLHAAEFWVLQSGAAILVLELFNYVAHYGMMRQVQGSRHAPLRAVHSWNAPGPAANWLLLDMGHHSAHHHTATSDANLLALPCGYAGAILLALIPPLWRRTMHPRLDQWLGGKHATSRAPAMLSHATPVAILCLLSGLLSGCAAGRIPPLPPENRVAVPDGDAVTRGAYLAAAGNCVSCHTDKKNYGQPFAGGGPVTTPFGTYYSRNITPDPVHGIGAWSDQAFLRAMRQGISPTGDYYFPAFPFTAFTGMSDRDILDIKAYLMTQKPSVAGNKPHAVSFPYNSRPMVGFWRLLYFKQGPLESDPSRSAAWNRGNYLVNAVAHCAECHTERNSLGALEDKKRFAGGRMATPGGKPVPNFATKVPNITPHMTDGIGKWSEGDIVKLLRLGMLPDGDFVAAPMSEVVDGTSQLTSADLKAIAVYLKSLPPLPGHKG